MRKLSEAIRLKLIKWLGIKQISANMMTIGRCVADIDERVIELEDRVRDLEA